MTTTAIVFAVIDLVILVGFVWVVIAIRRMLPGHITILCGEFTRQQIDAIKKIVRGQS